MYQSALSASDEQATNSQGFNGRILTLLTSEELEQGPCLPGLENRNQKVSQTDRNRFPTFRNHGGLFIYPLPV